MSQVNLRIPEEEYYLLELIAKRENLPITSLFRMIINPSFKEWKIKNTFDLYARGEIGFKRAMLLSGLTPYEFLDYLETHEIEPPHTESMERRSAQIADQLSSEQLLGDSNYKRKSRPKE